MGMRLGESEVAGVGEVEALDVAAADGGRGSRLDYQSMHIPYDMSETRTSLNT